MYVCYLFSKHLATESPILTSAIKIMGGHLPTMHKRNKFIYEEAVWPPNQAKLVVSVATYSLQR